MLHHHPDDATSASHPGTPTTRRGNFFAVDVPTYRAVCALGDADVAAAYLVLAAGTGVDNRTTSWSREAISGRTGLSWRRAREVVDRLVGAGFAVWLRRGARPRLDLVPFVQDLAPPSPAQPSHAQPSHASPSAGTAVKGAAQTVPRSKADPQARPEPKPRAKAETDPRSRPAPPSDAHPQPDPDPDPEPQIAWMPKALVDGVVGERAPVERVRLARDARALQLLVELYAMQDLAELAGVDRRWLRRAFTRESAGTAPGWQLWRFTRQGMRVRWGGPLDHHAQPLTPAERAAGVDASGDFFARLSILQDAGLVEWVYYLAEDEALDAGLIHPVAVERQGRVDISAYETILGSYALRAALALGSPDADADWDAVAVAQDWERRAPETFLLPAERVIRHVQLQGVPRLRYRARTSNALRWLDDLMQDGAAQIARYRQVIAAQAMEKGAALLEPVDQRLADFNATSMRIQCDLNEPSM